jgi:SAM-dependent methyltransferase
VSEHRAHNARRAARRGLDQHFLRSSRLAAELVRSAGLTRDDLVLEIGAGSGRLTAELARVAGYVLAVEIDAHWAQKLSERFKRDPRVAVVPADALEVGLPAEPFRVVANLPFGRTTALLHHLLDDPNVPLRRADLVVEWGSALKRAAVWPSSLLGVTWAPGGRSGSTAASPQRASSLRRQSTPGSWSSPAAKCRSCRWLTTAPIAPSSAAASGADFVPWRRPVRYADSGGERPRETSMPISGPRSFMRSGRTGRVPPSRSL